MTQKDNVIIAALISDIRAGKYGEVVEEYEYSKNDPRIVVARGSSLVPLKATKYGVCHAFSPSMQYYVELNAIRPLE